MVDGLRRQHEPVGDLAVSQAVREQLQHLELAPGEARRVGAGQCLRPAAQVARTALAQEAAAWAAVTRAPSR